MFRRARGITPTAWARCPRRTSSRFASISLEVPVLWRHAFYASRTNMCNVYCDSSKESDLPLTERLFSSSSQCLDEKELPSHKRVLLES